MLDWVIPILEIHVLERNSNANIPMVLEFQLDITSWFLDRSNLLEHEFCHRSVFGIPLGDWWLLPQRKDHILANRTEEIKDVGVLFLSLLVTNSTQQNHYDSRCQRSRVKVIPVACLHCSSHFGLLSLESPTQSSATGGGQTGNLSLQVNKSITSLVFAFVEEI